MSSNVRTDEQIREALQQSGGSISGAWALVGNGSKKFSGSFGRRCRRILASQSPIHPAVPDGFAPHSVTVRTGPDGEHQGQTVTSKPDDQAALVAVPDGFTTKRITYYQRADGTIGGQWVREQEDASNTQSLFDALDRTLTGVEGRAKPLPATEETPDADLLAVYPMGDPHLGMLAWAPEVGEDFDLHIASGNLRRAMGHLSGIAPPAEQALILQLGDFFHSDNAQNRTSRSGNALDVDGRWPKVLDVGIQAMIDCIDLALQRHHRVTVENLIGNHDDHSSIMLSHVLAAYYRSEPRVTVSKSPDPFRFHRFGACLIGAVHGDAAKPRELGGIMSADRAEDWGQTRHRRMYVGHRHHDWFIELPGCTVETLRTLAGKDAWHHRQGYRSDRDMKLDLWHREHGHVNRHIVGIDQVRATK